MSSKSIEFGIHIIVKLFSSDNDGFGLPFRRLELPSVQLDFVKCGESVMGAF